jgi:GntR family transcriptional regulator/MocR family aminotransferase
MTKLVLDGVGNLQQQISRAFRSAIELGTLPPNSRLSPTRVFAEEHKVSRNTVTAAYDQLCAEGYLDARQGSGTFVADINFDVSDDTQRDGVALEPRWSAAVKRAQTRVPDVLVSRDARRRLRFDFLYGEPSYQDLPIDRWARTIGRCARELTENQLGYGPLQGALKLRETLAAYLRRSRGVMCDAEQIFIVQGTQEAIDLTVRAFIDEGDCAVLEEPHYRGFKRCLLAAGAEIETVKVDESGIDTNHLATIKDARVAFVTPSHQFPHGSVMSLPRRQQLLSWAEQHRTVIVEDDYDGEFRYEGRPIPSLQSLDKTGNVIYLGTTSKMLFPALRLGWMVVPKQMVEVFKRIKSLADSSVTVLEQLALADFIENGHLERHIHKMRRAHQERREVLLSSIEKELPGRIEVTGTQAGIHVLVRLWDIKRAKTDPLIDLAARNEVGVYSASAFYSKAPAHVELLLGYASLTPQQIRTGVKRLGKVIHSF